MTDAPTDDGRWNHNIHYQRLILARVPPGAKTALDIGCGEGMLTRALHTRIPTVTGVDRHEPSIDLARAHGGGARYVLGDALTSDLPTADLVASIAALHHLDLAAGLHRLSGLVNPGGRLVVIGCARRSLPHDVPWEIAGAVSTRALRRRHGHWQHCAPMVDPPLTHRETKRTSTDLLPGARYRQLVLWRYLLDWTAPA